MLDRIKKILYDSYSIENITPETNIKNDLGLTSFDFLNLILKINNEFGIMIPPIQYREINTVEDLMIYLEANSK